MWKIFILGMCLKTQLTEFADGLTGIKGKSGRSSLEVFGLSPRTVGFTLLRKGRLRKVCFGVGYEAHIKEFITIFFSFSFFLYQSVINIECY